MVFARRNKISGKLKPVTYEDLNRDPEELAGINKAV